MILGSGLGWLTEAEVGFIDPHSVEDNPELSGESDLGPLGTAWPRSSPGPCFDQVATRS